MIKFLFSIFLTVNLWAGEIAVYQVWIDSFTPSEHSPVDFSDFETGVHIKCKDLPQPAQRYRLLNRTQGDVVIFDASAKPLPQVQGAISSGKIKYIGSYKWNNHGYKRDDEDWQILKDFFANINKSTYIASISSITIGEDYVIDGDTYTAEGSTIAASGEDFIVTGETYTYVVDSETKTAIIGKYDEQKGGWLTGIAGIIAIVIGNIIYFLRRKK